jgi:hypothetical protein
MFLLLTAEGAEETEIRERKNWMMKGLLFVGF